MLWYHYLACFWSGVFLANTVPHYVNGVSGNPFPTPFANPPGIGLSPPWVNVLWALFNMLLGGLLFWVGRVSIESLWSLAVFFSGIAFISIFLSLHFIQKDKE